MHFSLSLALFALVGSASAFTSVRPSPRSSLVAQRSSVSMMAYKYPASETLGIGKSIPSSVYGATSLLALFAGLGSTYQSNIVQPLTANTIEPLLVVGSALTLYSFFLHIAAFIQKKNGK